jgi:hypothetical protein
MRPERMIARGPRALVPVAVVFLVVAATAAFASQPGQDSTTAVRLSRVLASLTGADLPALPGADQFKAGPRALAAGTRTPGPVAVSDGNADVHGRVDGDVVTYRGDIIVHDRAEIAGNAIAIGGTVRMEGGRVSGQTLTLAVDGQGLPVKAAATPSRRIMEQLALVGGWLAILLVIAVGVLVLASDNLSAVADALERHYGSTLVAGMAGQVAFAPLLVALLVALVLSVLGILLVPFAAVAYVIVTAGLVTLGFLATAVVIGRGWRPAPPGSDRARRAATLRALLVGIVVLLSPWALAALLGAWPLAESLVRGVAFATTWVAVTAGLGAALISRAGITRAQSHQAKRAMASPSWQTPTPVSGVVAARRPTATPSQGLR